MNKDQAKLALLQGKKLSHRYFSQGEWVKLYSSTQYIFEDGCISRIDLFWSIRNGNSWDRDWSEVKS